MEFDPEFHPLSGSLERIPRQPGQNLRLLTFYPSVKPYFGAMHPMRRDNLVI